MSVACPSIHRPMHRSIDRGTLKDTWSNVFAFCPMRSVFTGFDVAFFDWGTCGFQEVGERQ